MSTADMINEYASEQMTCCSECDEYIPKDEADSIGKCGYCSMEHYCPGCGTLLHFVGHNGDDSDLRYAQEIWECPNLCDGWQNHMELCRQAEEYERKRRN